MRRSPQRTSATGAVGHDQGKKERRDVSAVPSPTRLFLSGHGSRLLAGPGSIRTSGGGSPLPLPRRPPEHSSSNSSGLYGSVRIGPSPVGGQKRQEDSDLLLMGLLLKWPAVLAVVPLVRNCSDVQPLLAELTGIINYWLSLCFCN